MTIRSFFSTVGTFVITPSFFCTLLWLFVVVVVFINFFFFFRFVMFVVVLLYFVVLFVIWIALCRFFILFFCFIATAMVCLPFCHKYLYITFTCIYTLVCSVWFIIFFFFFFFSVEFFFPHFFYDIITRLLLLLSLLWLEFLFYFHANSFIWNWLLGVLRLSSHYRGCVIDIIIVVVEMISHC